MTGAGRSYTRAAIPAVERRTGETLAALLSRLAESTGEALAGAALGGALGRGEAPTSVDADGAFAPDAPFELLVVLAGTPGRAAAASSRLDREVSATARGRRVRTRVETVSASALDRLSPTIEAIETAAANRVVAGPEGLLAPLAPLADARPSAFEALRLLVRSGAALHAAERALSRRGAGRPAILAAQGAVRDVDLALGTALLVSAGRFRPTDEARAQELRLLAAPSDDGRAASGFHVGMTRTRFRDVVDRHREAFSGLARVELPGSLVDARTQAARATDRFLEVLRLHEEERLGRPLPSWTDYLRVLSARRGASAAPGLFGARDGDDLPSRRAVREWPAAERLAPALATLLDWDPGDLPIARLLLDLPDAAPPESLAARLATLASAA